jgi:6-phosphogluconate dehydrogenase
MQQFGIIGLGTMGKSLARNFAQKGVSLSLYNRFIAHKEEAVAVNFIQQFTELHDAKGFEDLAAFVASIQQPRKILLMVQAGKAVDDLIDTLIPLLSDGDIIMDGGNSNYKDTAERKQLLDKHQLHFIGIGISGGEEGALKGPSIMVGGNVDTYKHIEPYLTLIAAKGIGGISCSAHIGNGAAGHFVKMVHNGIEYAEMQLLAELYAVLRNMGGYTPTQIAALFTTYLQTAISSYLLEITITILQKKEGNEWLIDKVLDKAGNKGTGSWATIAACELGIPINTITAALFARFQSAFLAERQQAQHILSPVTNKTDVAVEDLFTGYHLARIINHHQGFHLIEAASEKYGWQINLSLLAGIWTNGCIIRSTFMEQLITILQNNKRVLLAPELATTISNSTTSLQYLVEIASKNHVSIPCFASALHYLFAYTQLHLSTNLIQAQRDFFGAHTYQRIDDETPTFHHTNWTSQ